ncbi:MAG: protein kinase [Candidatus Competibacteraceae bacterium]|nr:protein kinase [Candidatus Competibacteraceae bacterium]
MTIYDVGITENNQLYLSIEYLSGGTLRERIQRGLSIDSAIYIVRCIAKALGYAHQNGVIHRDIKPSNIMFRYDDTPILTDFGVARVAESNTIHTAVGLMVGSPGYMSPQQAKEKALPLNLICTDLGVVLYGNADGPSLPG